MPGNKVAPLDETVEADNIEDDTDVNERIQLLSERIDSLQKQVNDQKKRKQSVKKDHDNETNSSSTIDPDASISSDDPERGYARDRRAAFQSSNNTSLTASGKNLFERRLNADDDYKALSEDTFTMMIMSKPGSKQWYYAFVIFAVQITLLTMILQDQYTYEYVTTPFDVPYKVSTVVHAGQLIAILLSLATQTDLVIAIITFTMLWTERRISWTLVAAVEENSHVSIWGLRVAMPLCCKFFEGVLVLLTTFVIVIQSDSMIELFKDFAAMQLISELDNMMFWLALHGYAGLELMEGAKKAKRIRIKDDISKSFCGIPFRTLILILIFMVMGSGWVYFVVGQVSGAFFFMKFPQCNITEAQIPRMGNGFCDGGAQNTIGCNFDDGDCLAFNIAYPGCRVVEAHLVGDGHCDPLFNTIECGFDGGDCCPVDGDDRLGDGRCDGFIFNTPNCDYDEGDCLEFNKNYPKCSMLENCTLEELYNEYHRIGNREFGIGDGMCHGIEAYSSPECGYEGGDCEECYQTYTSIVNDVIKPELFLTFGDGICNGDPILNTEICGYEGGDCYDCIMDNIDNESFNASLLGDGICDGGPYMSESCAYDAGDCTSFIKNYPHCETENPIYIGDNICDREYDIRECGYDGGDCSGIREKFNLVDCQVDDLNRIGNNICDGGEYLTEGCAFDGGDCDACPGNFANIGDGLCDGGVYETEACGFDGGDCLKNCDAKDIMRVGDGTCDEDLNIPDCHYDGGDCDGGGSVFGS